MIEITVKCPDILEAAKIFAAGMSAKALAAPVVPSAPTQVTPLANNANAAPVPTAPTVVPDEGKPKYDLVQVRAKLAELTKAGKDVKGLIKSYGVAKLTEIPEKKYSEIMAKAAKL